MGPNPISEMKQKMCKHENHIIVWKCKYVLLCIFPATTFVKCRSATTNLKELIWTLQSLIILDPLLKWTSWNNITILRFFSFFFQTLHSTKSDLNDKCLCIDCGDFVILVLLDLWAAFDTFYHNIFIPLGSLGLIYGCTFNVNLRGFRSSHPTGVEFLKDQSWVLFLYNNFHFVPSL